MNLIYFLFFCGFIILNVSSAEIKYNEGENCRPGNPAWICQEEQFCTKKPDGLKNICASRVRGTNLVCCPSETSNDLDQEYIRHINKRAASKAQQMCQKYAEYVYETRTSQTLDAEDDAKEKVDNCGISQESLIIGGSDAKAAEFPHMALIGHRDFPTLWLCAGSLISDQWVLSAAHCTATIFNTLAKWVLLGDLKIQDDEDMDMSSPLLVLIDKRHNHPGYKNSEKYNDIALYKLKEKVQFNKYIRPLCLHTPDMSVDDKLIAAGWGATHSTDKKRTESKMLQKVVLDLVKDTETCKIQYRNASSKVTKHIPRGIDKSMMICTYTPGKDSCYGDSGGPLMNKLKTPYCMYSIVGITSFGDDCAKQAPGVYTKVSNYLPWIESLVWP